MAFTIYRNNKNKDKGISAVQDISQNSVAGAVQHVFIIGSKSIGQYGGYETFVDRLIKEHENEKAIKYHVACKANGSGFMDESRLGGIKVLKRDKKGKVQEFEYRNAHVFKVCCPAIGPAVAIYYDYMAFRHCLRYCKEHGISNPVFYVLTCRIGLFIKGLKKQVVRLHGRYYLNPDGHEWKRAKWSAPVRNYWKWSEKTMVRAADGVICDSINIEKYIKQQYHHNNTTYIAYGADVEKSVLSDESPEFTGWLKKKGLKSGEYYLVVGRFVPENNYETMIREFMASKSKKDFALITNVNEKLKADLEKSLHFSSDPRIKFVGTVYDQDLLKKIRENAFAYFHGHEVGGTNPSLLEALGSTKVNLLLDVGFNREVAQDSALYWKKNAGNLADLIEKADKMPDDVRIIYGNKAKERIKQAYSWKFIGEEYKQLWLN